MNQYSQIITTSGQADILVRAPERVTASVPGASSVVVTPAANEPSVLDYDANGNIIAYSDQTGRLVQRRDYDPFGNPVITSQGTCGGFLKRLAQAKELVAVATFTRKENEK